MKQIAEFFLQTDVHLWITFGVAFAIMVYWTLAEVFNWKKIEPVTVIAILGIPAVMGFSANSILNNYKTKGDVDYFIKGLEDYADCSYAQDKLGEIRRDLLKFKARSVETFNVGETIAELLRAINKAKIQAIYIDHYILSWNNDLELLFQANFAALERRVEIKRIFILPDDILNNLEKLNKASAIMKRHRDIGIDVRFIRQRDVLESDPDYLHYALNNYCIIDNELLAVISPASQVQIIPIRSLLVWDPNRIKERSTFQSLLTSRYLQKFEADTDLQLFTNR